MSTTIATGDGYEVSSTHESAEEMTEALSPREETQDEPRVLVDKGKKVEPEPEKDGISKAAAELGKKGGEAAAKARKAKDKAAADAAPDADDDSEEESVSNKAAAEKASEGDTEKDPKKGNPRHDPQARVAQATREAREARERAEAAERRAAEVERRLEAAERARQEARDGSGERREQPEPERDPWGLPPKPESGNYETHDEYLDARDEWNRQRWEVEAQRKWQAHTVATQAAQRLNATITGIKQAVEKVQVTDPEFLARLSEDVKGCVPSMTLPPEQRARTNARNWIADQFLRKPEQATRLMAHLTDNPDVFQRVAALSSPSEVTWELATMYARLDAATTGTSARREVSKAKPPVTPVAGSPHTADDSLDDDAPYDAYVAAMNAKERRARR